MYKIFELTHKYISTRRKATTFTITPYEFEDYIKKTIFILEMRGDKYFNYSKVLNELIETQGFPDRKNHADMALFKECFKAVARRYQMVPNHFSNYTFKLKLVNNQKSFSIKRLIP